MGACSKMSEIDKLKETCDLEEVQACEKLTQIYQKIVIIITRSLALNLENYTKIPLLEI